MPTLIGLFEKPKMAEETVNQLAAAKLDDVEFQTLNTWEEKRDVAKEATPAINSGYGLGTVPAIAMFAPTWNLSDQETDFFRRAVNNGGVIIEVKVPDQDQVPQVERILQQRGQKVVNAG